MYTEIKETVNLIAKYLFDKIPRRPLSLFAEQLANHLARRYIEMWHTNDPTKDELKRCIHIRIGMQLDVLVRDSARAVNIQPEELMGIPDGIIVFVNPGHVYYKCGERAQPVRVWVGDVNADDNYSSMPEWALQPHEQTKSNLGAACRPFFVGMDKNDHDPTQYVYLRLETLHPFIIDSPLRGLHSSLKQFVYMPNDQKIFTVEEFAVTRFGSHRQRPDHDVMRRIQHHAAITAMTTGLPMCLPPTFREDGTVRTRPYYQQPSLDSFRSMSVHERQSIIMMLRKMNNVAEPGTISHSEKQGSMNNYSQSQPPVRPADFNGMGDSSRGFSPVQQQHIPQHDGNPSTGYGSMDVSRTPSPWNGNGSWN